jgi:hypothetical protein
MDDLDLEIAPTRWAIWETNVHRPDQPGRWATISRPMTAAVSRRSTADPLMALEHAADAWVSYIWTGPQDAAKAKAAVWNQGAAKGIYYEARPFTS